MSRKLTGDSVIGVSVAGLLGIAVAVFSVVSAIDKLEWLPMALNLLFFTCFALMTVYLYSDKLSSKAVFRSLITIYCISIVLRDLIFTDGSLPLGLSVLTGLLAVLEFAGLVILNTGWKNVRSVRSIMIFVVVADVVISSILTWNVLTGGSVYDNVIYSVTGVWIRPVVALSMTWCYFSRMKMKSLENKSDTK